MREWAAVAGLLTLNIFWVAAPVQAWTGRMGGVDWIEYHAISDFSGSPKGEVIAITQGTENKEFHFAIFDRANLGLRKALVSWTNENVGRFSLLNDAGTNSVRVLICRLWRQVSLGHDSESIGHQNRLGSPGIFHIDLNEEIFIGSNREWDKGSHINGQIGLFALYERPGLYAANNRQDGSENTNYLSPPQHGDIKFIVAMFVFGCISAGAFVGVWAAVIWDGLGRWRWAVCALGWLVI